MINYDKFYDGVFRKHLLANPKQTISEVFPNSNLADVNVEVVKNTKDKTWLVIPSQKHINNITPDILQNINVAKASSAGSVGSASCLSSAGSACTTASTASTAGTVGSAGSFGLP